MSPPLALAGTDAEARPAPAATAQGTTYVIGLGSEHGDDRLGWTAIEALAARELPDGVRLQLCRHPAAELLPLLAEAGRVVLVDAVVDGGPAGRLVRCGREDLHHRPKPWASSHGLSTDRLLELAAAIGALPATVEMIGVTIDPHQSAPAEGLSAPVRRALPLLCEALRAAVDCPAGACRGPEAPK